MKPRKKRKQIKIPFVSSRNEFSIYGSFPSIAGLT